jgi:hypothetical protein
VPRGREAVGEEARGSGKKVKEQMFKIKMNKIHNEIIFDNET